MKWLPKNYLRDGKVAVLVLNYNSGNYVIKCLDSLFEMEYPYWELFIGDNKSTDESFSLVRKYFQGKKLPNSLKFYELTENPKNFGFARGVNLLIKRALERKADFILILNPDTIHKSDFLRKLVNAARRRKELGALSPTVKSAKNGRIWFSGGKIRWIRQKAVHDRDKLIQPIHLTEFVPGCAMLIKKEVFERVGLLPEDYFLYYEDTDFCLQARRKGFKTAVVRDSLVFHQESISIDSGVKLYHLVLSGLKFFKKNTPLCLKPVFWAVFWLRWLRIKVFLKLTSSEKLKVINEAFLKFKENEVFYSNSEF